jgi:hypothetical protein
VSRAVLRFYGELADFLHPHVRGRDAEHRFVGHPTVKDAIEGSGVPHSEVHLVVLNGDVVSFDARLSDGDRVGVYPKFTSIDTTGLPALQHPVPSPARFVADVHLGIAEQIDAFRRCTVCNAPLEHAVKEDVAPRLPPRTRRDFDRFRRCTGCGRVYWEGSHHARLERFVDEVRARATRAAPG